ncbi:hypothetical protein FSP39_010655 [Pinctada imbricata]|uniref:Fibrinogen C-terminal domain-containing protein n=1 Tax=Pinctada imbricata TaxID=66713 RepID=A0AA89C5Z9_PINIB|nr:hypothetical protein FSP39_010655 [Pinctada imbricata]
MWKEYYVFIILFPCLNYVLCDTSSDDGPYQSPFNIELLQILKQISTRLHVISENTDRNWTLQFNAEMDNLKQENKNLRNDLETVLIETAIEKKKSLERDAEMDNLIQDNSKLKTDLETVYNETAIEKKRSLQRDAEIDNLKQHNSKLKTDLETVYNEIAIEKKRSLERDAEMDNLKQDNSKLKMDLETVYNETAIEKKRLLERDAEMDNLKQDNSKLKTDLEAVYNETAIEKKRSSERDAEMDNLKQDNKKLRNDLEKVFNETAMEKMRSQEMDNILMEKFKELQNLTLSLKTGSIATNDKFRINQEKANINMTNTLVKLEEKTNKLALFTNVSLKQVFYDVDSLNVSFSNLADFKDIFKGKDCGNLRDKFGWHNGVYTISPLGSEDVKVYCDMEDGGWTVFQRRINGKTDFYRGWNEYKDGFGDPTEEYWLGNKYLHTLTLGRDCTLKIDLTNILNITRHATFTNFKIESEADNYRLRIGKYSGNTALTVIREFWIIDGQHIVYVSVSEVEKKGGDLQQDPVAASTVKHQNTQC